MEQNNMNSINHIQLLFSLMTAGIILVGSLINLYEKYLPTFIKQVFLYGKFEYKGKSSFLKPVQVPKSWFRHFYIFSSVLSLYVLFLIVNVYVFNEPPSEWVIQFLDLACGYHRQATTTPTAVLIAVILLMMQCCRRLYDTQFVSVFSKSSRMDLTHYLVGFVHYFGTFTAVLAEAAFFTRDKYGPFKWEFTFRYLIATLIFLYAWYHQYQATVILANLRRNKKGHVVSNEHKVPMGDWFEYISSPHLVAEILMYFSLTLLLYKNQTFWFVFFWVLSNQVETALLSHWWYQSTFADFPTNRRALIPFVY